jgi:hypothetical protein
MNPLDNIRTAVMVGAALGAVVISDKAAAQPVEWPSVPLCNDVNGQHLNSNSNLTLACGTSASTFMLPAWDVLGNPSGVTAPAEAASLSSIIDGAMGSTEGEVLQRGPSGWITLGPGTAGQQLVSGGAAAPNLFATTEHTWGYSFSSNVNVTTGTYPIVITQAQTLIIDGVSAYTGGSASPSFVVAVTSNGTTLTGCGAITVSIAVANTACTGANTIALGAAIDLVVVSVTGTPNGSLLQINWHPVVW